MALSPGTLAAILDRAAEPEEALRIVLRELLPASGPTGAGAMEVAARRPDLDWFDLPELARLAQGLLATVRPPDLPGTSADPLERLGGLPGQTERLREVLFHAEAYARGPVLEGLLRRGEALRAAGAAGALEYAELALVAASLLPADRARLRRRVTARAHLLRANLFRLGRRFGSAEEALRQARRLLESPTEADVLVRFHCHAASLALDRRRPQVAVQHLDAAERMARGTSSSGDLARVFTLRAIVVASVLRLGEADRLLARAGKHLRPVDDPELLDLALCVAHNRAHVVLHLGRTREAMDVYRSAPELYERTLPPGRELRHQWLLGRIARSQRDLRLARQRLQVARELAEGLGQPFPAAVLDLDLGVVQLESGGSPEGARLVRRGVDALWTLDLPSYATGALLALTDATASGGKRVPPAVVDGLLHVLRHATVPPRAQGTVS